MFVRVLSFLVFMVATAGPAASQTIDGDKIVDAGPGEYAALLAHAAAHTYRLHLAKDEAIVAALEISNETGRLCYEDVELILLDAKGTRQDFSSVPNTPADGSKQRIGVAFKNDEAGIHSVVIARQESGETGCQETAFPYLLSLKVFRGHAAPTRSVQAVNGVYRDGLAFADVHHYLFTLANNKSVKALLNINSGMSALCHNDVTSTLFDARGTKLADASISSVPHDTDVNSSTLEYRAERTGAYTLQVVREPSADGLECDEATFPYELFMTLPEGASACPKKAVKTKCKLSCKSKCKKSRKASCKKSCVKKCTAKGRC